MKINEDNYLSHHNKDFINRLITVILLGGFLVTLSLLFFLLKTDLGREFSTDPYIHNWILTYFPQAQYWVNHTLQFKQEIVLIYFLYICSLGLALSPLVYLLLLNRNKLKECIQLWFIQLRLGKHVCEKLPKFILASLVFAGLFYICIFIAYPGVHEAMNYEGFKHSTGYRGFSEYDLWNTFGGLTFIVFVKSYMGIAFFYIAMLSFISIGLCFFKKEDK